LTSNSNNITAYRYSILKVTTSANATIGSGSNEKPFNVKLTGYLSIPVRASKDYTSYNGGTSIIYDSSGVNPQYYQNEYSLYKYNTSSNKKEKVSGTNFTWNVTYGNDTHKTGATTNTTYYPSINNKGRLIVPSMYL